MIIFKPSLKVITVLCSLCFCECVLASSLNQEKGQSETKKPYVQDVIQAFEYFRNELNFTTNPAGVKAVVEGKVKNVTIVDVRTEKDYNRERIPGSVNIPFNKHSTFEGDELEF